MNDFVQSILSPGGALSWIPPTLTWVVVAAFMFVGAFIIFVCIAAMAIGGTYFERRIAGWIQGRLGPNRVGPFGLLQPIVDGVKLLAKEDIVPTVAAKWLYSCAPALVFVGVFIPFAALPFSNHLVVTNMAVAVYYIVAFAALEVVGILMAGWAPGSKWSLYGGMRLAAQMLSYEIPMSLAIIVVVFFAESLNFQQIVAWQQSPAYGFSDPYILGWAIFRSPACFIAFFVFFISGIASAKRAPFDLPEAESELVAGYHTEYSGMRFAFFFMAEYAAMYLVSALAAILFLGGWSGPLPGDSQSELIGLLNLLGKSLFLYFVMIWIRWTLPRIRIDQVMHLCLKVLLPLAILSVILAAAQIALAN